MGIRVVMRSELHMEMALIKRTMRMRTMASWSSGRSPQCSSWLAVCYDTLKARNNMTELFSERNFYSKKQSQP